MTGKTEPTAAPKGALGKGMDAQEKAAAIATGDFPVVVTVENLHKRTLVLAQATPSLVIGPKESVTYTCHTPGHLYDVVFGMIAVGDHLEQEIIGSINLAKKPKEAPTK